MATDGDITAPSSYPFLCLFTKTTPLSHLYKIQPQVLS